MVRKVRVFHLCADELDIWGDLYVVTANKEKAIKLLLKHYEERIRQLVADITDELTEEEYKEWLEEERDTVIEEH